METIASILVVDDQTAVREVLGWTLEKKGYRVLTAGDGIEALDVLKAQPVDLILADIAMPHMNGFQLYERVVENPQWVAIPFLFLTARALDSDIRYGKELGVDDYLTKPIKSADLLATVRGKLRRAKKLAQSSTQPIDFASLGHARDRQGGPIPRPTLGSDVLALGRLRIELGQHRVWLDGQRIRLSAREFGLLERLAGQANKVVSLQELVKATRGLDTDHVEAGELLRPLIRSLRRKLGYPGGDLSCIENVHGVGYRLIPPSDSCYERREVTVLFLDMANSTVMAHVLDSEDIYLLTNEAMRLLAEVVYKYEGTIDKYTGDGLMALFGAPVAHENDPECAVRAALEMHTVLQPLRKRFNQEYDLDFQVRIGINTGPVIAGQIGSDRHREYTVIGDTVNLASRLETAAEPGTILVSFATYQRTRLFFRYKTLPPFTVKGKPHPIRAFRPLGL